MTSAVTASLGVAVILTLWTTTLASGFLGHWRNILRTNGPGRLHTTIGHSHVVLFQLPSLSPHHRNEPRATEYCPETNAPCCKAGWTDHHPPAQRCLEEARG